LVCFTTPQLLALLVIQVCDVLPRWDSANYHLAINSVHFFIFEIHLSKTWEDTVVQNIFPSAFLE
jgi:hypothetical protein